ncbi:unnamed protein product [Zymoseptoria tritici ST99CH_1A5]|uniref:Tat pathway signal sequence n=2 Tax=Zymoseptoria tritici TaxID=1047171 RepID=A0A2H1GZE2_ZYMTR|nr:unnamed protein product [Zymoseptoria tritici ST99CH_1E4]SMR62781.1 unnamed protein product [Zymoseptoria tritici ST99CH_3D1]SMY28148.1 unnamed protein product [Zymoseptoria tritici ST99CH_1A5]
MAFKALKSTNMLRADQKEDAMTLLGNVEAKDEVASEHQTWPAHIWKFRWFIAALVVSNLTTLFTMMDYARNHYSLDFRNQVDAVYGGKVNRDLSLRRFDRFHFHLNSEYTAPPSEKVERAWADFGIWLPHFILPKSLGPTFGLNNSHYWIPEETHGTEGYPVVPEMIHQLHCLNSIRKSLYYNHEYYAEKSTQAGEEMDESFMKAHLNHCVDALRERLLCLADVGVTPFLWRDEEGRTMPDFETEHKCHDHNAVISWWKDHAIPLKQSDVRVLPPPEAVLHPEEEFF